LKEQIQFPVEPNLVEYSRALTEAIRTKTLHRALESEGFRNFLDFITASLAVQDKENRLRAVALACKVAISAKSAGHQIEQILNGPALASPLPPLGLLSDPDDRYYAANIWRYTSRDWIPQFLTMAAIEEESAENSRRECIYGLLTLLKSVGEIFRLLESNLRAIRFRSAEPRHEPGRNKKRSEPGDILGRRLRRVFTALNLGFTTSRHHVEEDFGSNLRSFLRNAFRHTGSPKETIVRSDLANEILSLILLAARSRYKLALLADTYSPIVTMRDWFTDWEWRDFTENDPARNIALSIQGALELLAQSGRVDNDLFMLLTLASGGTDQARSMAKEIVQQNPGLAPEVSAWLSGEQIRKSTKLSSESQMVQIEEAIADTALSGQAIQKSAEAVETDLLPQLSIFQSIPLSQLKKLLSDSARLRHTIQSLCHMRGIEFFASVDAEEEFSPLRHEFENPSDLGARMVRIIQPGVRAPREDGSYRIIRKALVVPS